MKRIPLLYKMHILLYYNKIADANFVCLSLFTLFKVKEVFNRSQS